MSKAKVNQHPSAEQVKAALLYKQLPKDRAQKDVDDLADQTIRNFLTYPRISS